MGQISYLYKYSRKAYGCKCLIGGCNRFNPHLCDKAVDDQPVKPKNVLFMSEFRKRVKLTSVKEY